MTQDRDSSQKFEKKGYFSLFSALLPLYKLTKEVKGFTFWLTCSLVGMVAYTFAAQLEVLTIGIATEKAQAKFGGQDLISKVANTIKAIFPIDESVLALAFLIIAAAVLKSTFLFIYRYCSKVIGIRVAEILRRRYFQQLQKLPCSYYLGKDKRHLSSRILGDALLVADSMQSSLINYVQTPLMLATTLIFCFLTSWKLSLLIFVGVPLVMMPVHLFSSRIKAIAKSLQGNQERLASVLIDFLGGLTTVKIFGMEDFSDKKYAEVNGEMARFEEKNARYEYATRPFVHAIGMSFLALGLVFGLYVLEMSRAEVLVYCGLIFLMYEPIKKFSEETTRIQRGIAASERLFEVINDPAVEKISTAGLLPREWKKFSFEKVGFRYENHFVLKDVSFDLNKGEFLAVVGPTGSGKSTLASLILQLFEPSEGSIKIDGKPLAMYQKSACLKGAAFVPQKPFLFIGSIEENIVCGRNLNKEALLRAAKDAYAEEFIDTLPRKYATVLEEGGGNLSGGQQQRIALARCLAEKKDILVLDEATSSLDALSESAIRKTLQEIKGQVTLVVIAHRLSSIQDADRILYLEKGKKIALGTKEELLESSPSFRYMWETAFNIG